MKPRTLRFFGHSDTSWLLPRTNLLISVCKITIYIRFITNCVIWQYGSMQQSVITWKPIVNMLLKCPDYCINLDRRFQTFQRLWSNPLPSNRSIPLCGSTYGHSGPITHAAPVDLAPKPMLPQYPSGPIPIQPWLIRPHTLTPIIANHVPSSALVTVQRKRQLCK